MNTRKLAKRLGGSVDEVRRGVALPHLTIYREPKIQSPKKAHALGVEALRMLEREPFDVVLMDVYMPVMDGHTAAREIRRREHGSGRHVPIIAVTASATSEIVQACAAAGMDHFLSKPLRLDALRDLLRPIQAQA